MKKWEQEMTSEASWKSSNARKGGSEQLVSGNFLPWRDNKVRGTGAEF